MKKLLYLVLTVCAVSTSMFIMTGCEDSESYAKQKEKEKNAINQFLLNNDIVGRIKVISESDFYAQDSTTNIDENEFVLFNEDGIYMQIVRKGTGLSMIERAKARPDSTARCEILCKFFEYDIKANDTTCLNIGPTQASINDKMRCTYSHYSRSYEAYYTVGKMKEKYGSNVPKGWLKPLNFIRLTKVAGEEAKVRIIVPHSSGTNNASGYVLPFYYEITYQIPPNG